MVARVTFRDPHQLAHFNMTSNGNVKVASVLTRFTAERIEKKDLNRGFTVLDADNEGWSLAVFLSGSIVDIRCTPMPGKDPPIHYGDGSLSVDVNFSTCGFH